MPRPASLIPAYRKHSSGQARVTINGRDYLLGPFGSVASRAEYDRIIAEYLESGRSASFGISREGVTVAMVMADYLAHAKAYYGTGASSELHRIKLAIRPIKALYASMNAAEFGPEQFKAVRQTLIRGGGARTTINAHMKRVVRMFKWAAAEGKVPAAVHSTLTLISSLRRGRTEAKETKPVGPVSQEVVDATVAFLQPTVADMVRVQLLTGCRPSEICKLTPRMIDRSADVWTATLGEHKTAHHGHVRTLYIGPKAQAILLTYLAKPADEAMFRPCDAAEERRKRDHDERVVPLSCGNRPGKSNRPKTRGKTRVPGTVYTVPVYARAIKRAAEKAGVEHWSPNRLRHSRGTEVRSRFGLDAAAAILGHSEVGVTQVYAEQDRQKAIEVARRIG
jgi:integrase